MTLSNLSHFVYITLFSETDGVTLSNMSHFVYITFFGETDGVTLSRLDCIDMLEFTNLV